MIINFSKLKEKGVRKIFKLEDGPTDGVLERRLFIANNDAASTRIICNQINAEKNQRPTAKYWIAFVPKITKVCDLLLEEQGVYGYVHILELPLSFIPLDTDLFSLEQESIHDMLYLRKNQTAISNISRAIQQLFSILGGCAKFTGVGKSTHMAFKLSDVNGLANGVARPKIDHLIAIDREVDYYSLLLSSLNYQGLLDETFQIKCAKIEIPSDIAAKEGVQLRKYLAQSSDPIFKHIRDSHLSIASADLKRIAAELKDNMPKSQEMSIQEMKDFIQKELKNKKASQRALKLHISLCEIIMEKKKENEFGRLLTLERNIMEGAEYRDCVNQLEELIICQKSPLIALRLLCLLSLSNDGIAYKDYHQLMKLFLHSYGHQHLITICNLNRLKLLYRQGNKSLLSSPNTSMTNVINQSKAAAMSALPKRSQLRNLVRKFNLTPEPSAESNSKDASFVFGGNFVPIVYRITESVLNGSWVSLKEQLSPLSKFITTSSFTEKTTGGAKPVIAVLMIGGITYAEVSALRFLSQQKNFDLIILTTNMVNGDKFLTNLMAP
uniref:Vacuolar protein sorting-associated protein 33B n=2 Tax=Tetranychus urticae TaxID=32264 RepID=T1KXI7_TETUR